MNFWQRFLRWLGISKDEPTQTTASETSASVDKPVSPVTTPKSESPKPVRWTEPFADPLLGIPDQTAAGQAVRAKLPSWYQLIAKPTGYAARELLWTTSTYPGGLRDDPQKMVDAGNRMVREPEYDTAGWIEIGRQLFAMPKIRTEYINQDPNSDHGIWLVESQGIPEELRKQWGIPTLIPGSYDHNLGRNRWNVVV